MKPFAHLILAIVVCALALFAYAATYEAVSAKSDVVAGLQAQIDAHTATVNRLTSARATLAELSADESSLENYFIAQSGIVPFIDGLQADGRTLGTDVQVQSVSTGGSAARPVLTLTLVIQGPFDGVMRTVGAIEYGPYAVSVMKLDLTALDKGTWQASLDMQVGSRADATSTKP